jgi:hypothetical protein
MAKRERENIQAHILINDEGLNTTEWGRRGWQETEKGESKGLQSR